MIFNSEQMMRTQRSQPVEETLENKLQTLAVHLIAAIAVIIVCIIFFYALPPAIDLMLTKIGEQYTNPYVGPFTVAAIILLITGRR